MTCWRTLPNFYGRNMNSTQTLQKTWRGEYFPFYEAIVVVVQSLSHVRLFLTPQTAVLQASLSFTISRSLLKLMSVESDMPFNHLILCHPLLLHLQSFLTSGSFPMSLLFASDGQNAGALASASSLQ